MDSAFQPAGAQGTTPAASTLIAVTTSVQQVALPSFNARTMRLVNDGTAKMAWSYGVSPGLTMTNGALLLPNTVETFSTGGATQLSVIGSAAGSNLSISVGEGS